MWVIGVSPAEVERPRAEVLVMHTTAAPTRTAPRHQAQERTPNPVASIVFCLAVLAGGLLGAQHWLDDTCLTTPELAQVCAATADMRS